ncbi:MAG TPA: PLP-dependent aminotransferase family protein [Actinomycetes bacterium]
MTKSTGRESQQTSSRELLLDLAGAPKGRLGSTLQWHLRHAIRSGRLRAQASLPSTRALAADLGVSRSVVVQAYEQLAAEGYLVTRQGAAARVAAVQPPADAGRTRPSAPPAPDRAVVDFRPGTADLGSFPRADWERAYRRALVTLPNRELGYGDSRGLARLREGLADYLGRVRGAVVDPEHLIVVNGFAQALVVVARLFRALGIAEVGVEDPGSFHTEAQLAAHDLATVGIPVDRQGVDAGALTSRPGPPVRAVLATPAHQFPTGVVLSAERRRQLLAWVERVDGYLIEDDYDAEYRYDHQPVATVQGLAPGRVLLGGSISKTLAPALRLGWLAVPPPLAQEAARRKRELDLMSPVLEQAALAELLASGAYERHIRRNRARYRRRRDQLQELLAGSLPRTRVAGAAAGLHLLLDLPAGADEAAVIARAASRGLRLTGLGSYRHAPGPPGLVLAYAHLDQQQLRRGVRLLAEATG